MARGQVLARVFVNVGARGLAIAGLAVATIAVARGGGPTDVGSYALVRLLSGLVGVVGVAGLPGALGYFLAEPRRATPRLWPTILVLMGAGSGIAFLAWLALTPVFASTFFPDESRIVVAAAGVAVVSQIILTCAKTALQGLEDHRAGDRTIALEEWAFVPTYLLALALGLEGMTAILAALVAADVLVAIPAWRWVRRRTRVVSPGVRVRWGGADMRLGREVVAYGARGQLGGILVLVSLRLDFAILAALTTPAVLGVYAIASKYAELLRLVGTALTWVTYPRMARLDDASAAHEARRVLIPALGLVAVGSVPAFLVAGWVIGLFYGASFDAAEGQARVLVMGMLVSGGAGVASGYFYGRGRPGLNSSLLGLGLAITATLDIILVPRYGAMGAAVASTISYLVTDVALVIALLRLTRGAAISARSPATRRSSHVPVGVEEFEYEARESALRRIDVRGLPRSPGA
jgi:O-antigen/teichoic acid export membrane protein